MLDMIEYAKRFIGTSYRWGGNSVDEGFDCSGFICEVLRSIGLIGNKEDLTAKQLYERFHNHMTEIPMSGNLVFFGSSADTIIHVAMMIDTKRIIEAGGEGRVETKRGMVRIRPLTYRSDLFTIIRM